jgi:hypothetical protein
MVEREQDEGGMEIIRGVVRLLGATGLITLTDEQTALVDRLGPDIVRGIRALVALVQEALPMQGEGLPRLRDAIGPDDNGGV